MRNKEREEEWERNWEKGVRENKKVREKGEKLEQRRERQFVTETKGCWAPLQSNVVSSWQRKDYKRGRERARMWNRYSTSAVQRNGE